MASTVMPPTCKRSTHSAFSRSKTGKRSICYQKDEVEGEENVFERGCGAVEFGFHPFYSIARSGAVRTNSTCHSNSVMYGRDSYLISCAARLNNWLSFRYALIEHWRISLWLMFEKRMSASRATMASKELKLKKATHRGNFVKYYNSHQFALRLHSPLKLISSREIKAIILYK